MMYIEFKFIPKTFFFLIAILILLEPPIFVVSNEMANIDKIYDYLKVACSLPVFFWFVINNSFFKKVVNIVFLISGIWVVQVLSSIYYDGNIKNAVSSYMCVMAICMIVYSMAIDNYDTVLNCIAGYLTVLALLNLITQIMFPMGLLQIISIWEDEIGLWILGGVNTTVSFALPATILQCIRYERSHKLMCIVWAAISSSTIIIADSATGLVGLVVFLSMFFIRKILKLESVSRVFNINTYVIISAIIIIMFLLIGNFSIFEKIIVDILGRDMTLTTRTEIWDKVKDEIVQNWIFGHGIPVLDEFRRAYGASHLHDYYLQLLYQGGVVTLLAFCWLLNICRKKLYLNRKSDIAHTLSAGIFGFLIMFISEVYDTQYLLPFYILLMLSLSYSPTKQIEGE